jgi:hypothetical protein
MKLFEKIKLFFKDDSPNKTEEIIIAQKSCPNCTNRGMFVFNDRSNIITKIGELNEKHN